MTDNPATIKWGIEDIQSLRPGWTDEQCTKWLTENSKAIVDRSIELGWDIIEDLLPSE